MYTFGKWSELDAKRPSSVMSTYINMMLFVDNITLLRYKIIMVWYLAWHIGVLQMIVLRLSMQKKIMIEQIDGKCHVLTFWFPGGRNCWAY